MANFITFDEVKYQLTEDPAKIGTDDQNLIESLISSVCSMIETYCNRKFVKANYVEYPETYGGNMIFLKHIPIVQINNLWIDTSREFDSSTLIDSDDYFVNLEKGIVIYESGNFPSKPYCVKVDYEAGWESENVPKDLKQVAIEMVLVKYDRIKKKELDVVSRNVQGGSVIFRENDLLPQHKLVLTRYALPN